MKSPSSLLAQFSGALGLPLKTFRSGGHPASFASKVVRLSPAMVKEALPELITWPELRRPVALAILDPEKSSTPASVVLEELVAHADDFPLLQGIFLGEMKGQPSGDGQVAKLGKLLESYPELEVLGIEGDREPGSGDVPLLSLEGVQHEGLRQLYCGSSIAASDMMNEFERCGFPRLDTLVMRFNEQEQADPASDFKTLFSSELPRLRHLGLLQSLDADRAAALLGESAILEQVRTLDLSWGRLTDVGGQALLDAPATGMLHRLVLYGHQLSEEMVDALAALPLQLIASAVAAEMDWDPGSGSAERSGERKAAVCEPAP